MLYKRQNINLYIYIKRDFSFEHPSTHNSDIRKKEPTTTNDKRRSKQLKAVEQRRIY